MLINRSISLIIIMTSFAWLVFLSGCSKREIEMNKINLGGQNPEGNFIDNDPTLAKSYFIQGCISEQNGNLDKAISEYERALLYQKSAGIYFSLGSVYLQQRKFALSAINLKKAVELDSINIEYQLKLGVLYSFTFQEDDAIEVYDKIIKKDSTYSKAYYFLAKILSNKKPLRALEVYGKLIKQEGEDISIYTEMAEIYNRIGDLKNAANILEKMIYLAPDILSLKTALVEIYLRLKDYSSAEKTLVDLVRENPEDFNLKELLAQIYIEKGNWEAASKEFQKILRVDSVDVNIKYRMAMTYFEKAFEDTNAIVPAQLLFLNIDSTVSNFKTWLFLSAISLFKKDTVKAELYINRIKGIEVGQDEIWYRIGGIFFDKRKFNEASYFLTKGYNYYQENYPFNFLLGITHLQLNNFSTSFDYLKKATEISDKDINCLSSLGYVLGKLGRYPEAIDVLNKATKISLNDLNVLSTLATIYNDSGKFQECDSIYKIAFQAFPDNALLLNNYAYSLAERNIRLDEALEFSKKAVEQDSLNESYLDTIGWIYFRLGNIELAEKYVRKAVDLGSASAEVLEHMGDIYFLQNNKELAIIYWKKSLEKEKERSGVQKKINEGL